MMNKTSKPPRKLMWLSLFVMAVLIVATGVSNRSHLPKGIAIETQNQPTLGYGQAKVHIVVFEEPKCINCKSFSLDVFPQLKKEFIDTKKVRLTMIPVSFLPGSMPAAIAMLSVYNADPQFPNNDLFFKYTETLYEQQGDEDSDWASIPTLVNIAKMASPAIDPHRLEYAILHQKNREQIEKNTLYGTALMGGVISTPTVYVNGVSSNDLSFEGLSLLIRAFLKKEGVY